MDFLTQKEISTLIEIMKKLEQGEVFTTLVLDGIVMFDRRNASKEKH